MNQEDELLEQSEDLKLQSLGIDPDGSQIEILMQLEKLVERRKIKNKPERLDEK